MGTTPQNRRQKQKRLRRVDLLVCASKEHYVSKDEAQRQARRAHKHTGIPSRWYICDDSDREWMMGFLDYVVNLEETNGMLEMERVQQ